MPEQERKENIAQKILRQEFIDLKTNALLTINDFDPNASDAFVTINLATGYPEYEEQENHFAINQRLHLLKDLSLLPLTKVKKDILFHHVFENQTTKQINFITNEKGTKIPVFTLLAEGSDEIDTTIIQLLSYDQAENLKKTLDDEIIEEKMDRRLASEFNIYTDFTEIAGIGFEEKRTMLAGYDHIENNFTTGKWDNYLLETVKERRRKLVKSMFSPTELLKNTRNRQLPHRIRDYSDELERVLNDDMDLDDQHALIERERLLRLSYLNRQITAKDKYISADQRLTRGAYTTVGGALGAVGGAIIGPLTLHTEPTTGAKIGLVVGGFAGLKKGIDTIKDTLKERKAPKKIHDNDPQDEEIGPQIYQEIELANEYFKFFNSDR